MRVQHTYETPDGTRAYAAYLYFDDGDYPNAEVELLGYFTEEPEAWDAIRAALAGKPARRPSTVTPGNTAVWCGMPELGTFVKHEGDDWFHEPDFERDEDYNPESLYRDD